MPLLVAIDVYNGPEPCWSRFLLIDVGTHAEVYVVIFRAMIRKLDSEYFVMASRLSDLAMTEYGCTQFIACTEGEQEIAVSYWPSTDHIKAWHRNPIHLQA